MWEGLYAPTLGVRNPSGHKAPPHPRQLLGNQVSAIKFPFAWMRVDARLKSVFVAKPIFSADHADERG